MANGAKMVPMGPAPLEPAAPDPQTPEESAEIIKATCREVVLEATRAGKEIAELGPLCHRKYGRGAFVVHFGSLEDARGNRPLAINQWIEHSIRQSDSYPLSSDGPVPGKVLEAAKAFSCDCPEGELGSRVLFRRAARLMEQLPSEGAAASREALETYDPAVEICVCGEVLAGSKDNVFNVAGRLPLSTFAGKQEEQRKRWETVREHVTRLKSWGNDELSDKEVGVELASKTYREALRILLESELQELSLERALRLNLAEALARLGRWAESAEECDRVLSLEPENIKALFRRGRARLRLGEAELSRADLVRAARAAPQDRAVREELELARRYVPPPPRPAAAPQGEAPQGALARAASVALLPKRAVGGLLGYLSRAAPGIWRQFLLCLVSMLAYRLLGRRQQLQAKRAQAKPLLSPGGAAVSPKTWLQTWRRS